MIFRGVSGCEPASVVRAAAITSSRPAITSVTLCQRKDLKQARAFEDKALVDVADREAFAA